MLNNIFMKYFEYRLVLTVVVLLFGCSPDEYYLDKQTYYIFKPGDTLFYDGNKTDTFKVTKVNDYIMNSDKKDYEIFDVNLIELTRDCKDSLIDYCNCANWTRGKADDFSINFRNVSYIYLDNVSYNDTYKIGSHLISNVHIYLNNSTSKKANNKSIKKVYYSHRLGIISYELLNGNKYEMRESLIK